MIESKRKNLEIFRDFCRDRLQNTVVDESNEQLRQQFLKEYPIDRIKTMSPEEYCIGTPNSKKSFSYAIEFGKYKDIGFGIGGGSSQKFGIYYNKNDKCYKHRSSTITDIEQTWPLF